MSFAPSTPCNCWPSSSANFREALHMRVAGVMSGTSLDGIDVAIVDIRGNQIETIAFHSTPYPAAVREALLNLSSVAEVSRLNFLLGELYAKAILATRQRIELIGLHGQT